MINQFTQLAQDPRISFFGNVRVGRDLSLDELRSYYNAVGAAAAALTILMHAFDELRSCYHAVGAAAPAALPLLMHAINDLCPPATTHGGCAVKVYFAGRLSSCSWSAAVGRLWASPMCCSMRHGVCGMSRRCKAMCMCAAAATAPCCLPARAGGDAGPAALLS